MFPNVIFFYFKGFIDGYGLIWLMLTTYQNFVLIYGTVVKLLPCYFFIHSLFWNKSVTVLLHLVLETWDHENVKIWPFYLMIVFIPSYKLFLLLNYVLLNKVYTMCLIFMNTVIYFKWYFYWIITKYFRIWVPLKWANIHRGNSNGSYIQHISVLGCIKKCVGKSSVTKVDLQLS